jgi:ketosteroid isomerase-like protein
MQNTKLIEPVANYIAAANAQDIEAVTENFSEDAVVRDEGQNRQGIAAIRQWAVEVSMKYRPTVETLDVAQADGRTILTGRVSGNFPGSPVELRYVFTLDSGKIERLEIS